MSNNNNNNKPIDYYDRIADALEVISGDSSHIDDESPTMDYYDRIADALEEIAEGGGGPGSGLPAVTSNDNGNVLTVVEGAWTKAAPSSPSGMLVVTVTGSGDNFTSNTTFSQIKTAITNGSFVVCRHSDGSGLYSDYILHECYLSDNSEEAEDEYAMFSQTSTYNAVATSYISIAYNDSVTFKTIAYPSN